MADQIRYDLLPRTRCAAWCASVLSDVARKGLPGEHHFYVTFDTKAPGVRISEPPARAVSGGDDHRPPAPVLGSEVSDTGFEVGLSFGGIPEQLVVPFEAINGFFDPSVQFGLQFEEVTEGEEQQPAPTLTQDKAAGKKSRTATSMRPPAAAAPEKAPAVAAVPDPTPDKPMGGGEVVRLDRFRKK